MRVRCRQVWAYSVETDQEDSMNEDATNHTETSSERPLQGWKEVAAYLDRDESTARRWEREVDLPIRRHRADRRSSVYAYPSEIEAWRAARPTQSEAETPVPVPLWRRMEAWAAVAVGVAAVLVITYGPFLNPRNPVAEAAEGSMRTEQVWTGEAASGVSRLSADGKWLIYTDWSTGDFWLRDTASGESRRITDKGPWTKNRSYAETGVISPDGKKLAAGWYNDEIGNYELRIGPLPPPGETDNGEIIFQSPIDQAGYVEAVGWLSDSQALVVHAVGHTTTYLKIADVERDNIEVLKTFGWDYPNEVAISPDRRWIAYGSSPSRDQKQQDVFVLAADGSTESRAVEHSADDKPVGWTPDGSHLLFRSSRTPEQSLWAVPMLDGKPSGNPLLVSSEFTAMHSFGVSPEGDLFYLKRTGTLDVLEVRIDVADGRVIQKSEAIAATAIGDNFDPVYSPDGKWMAYLSNRNLGSRYGSTRIVVRDIETAQEHDLSPTLSGIRNLAWSPDSSSLLFRARENGRVEIYKIGLTRGAAEQLLWLPLREGEAVNAQNVFWMPDGQSLHYRDGYGGSHWIHDLESGEYQEILTLSGKGNSMMTLSPDSKRLAVVDHSRDESTVDLFTLDRETGQRRELWDMHIADGSLPPLVTAWTRDSQSILFWKRLPDRKPTVVELWAVPAEGGDALGTELSAENLTGPVRTLSLHPDGERIAFSAGDAKHEIWKLSNFLSRLGVSD